MSNARPETMERITNPELAQAFIDEQLAAQNAQIGVRKVLLALSGGVGSSDVAALLIKAVGKTVQSDLHRFLFSRQSAFSVYFFDRRNNLHHSCVYGIKTMKEMTLMFRRILYVMLLSLLALFPSLAGADGQLTAEPVLGIYDTATEKLVRNITDELHAPSLKPGEYYSFGFKLSNSNPTKMQCSNLYARIDGGDPIRWKDRTFQPGQTVTLHIVSKHMKKVSAGIHRVSFYADGKLVRTASFTMPKNWGSVMKLPTAAELKKQNIHGRSPYIVFCPEFPGVKGFTEYSVDVNIEYSPKGTYVSLMNWEYDFSELKKKYKKVYTDYGLSGGYCGLQTWGDGTQAVIMTLWTVFAEDNRGNKTAIKGKLLKPENQKNEEYNDSFEGSFVHCVYEYDWKPGNPYRVLVQMYPSQDGQTTLVSLWLCDLVTNRWDEVIVYDTCLKNAFMKGNGCGFLECYETSYSADLRTVELSNFRARSVKTNQWVSGKKVTFTVNTIMNADKMHFTGSYNFGADGNTFWIATTGLKNRCRLPRNKTYTVNHCASGSPY